MTMPPKRVPAGRRRLSDLLAASAAAAVLTALAWSVWLFAHREALLAPTPGLRAAQVVITALGAGACLAMWGWMAVNCAATAARDRNRHLLGWLVLMVVLWPAAWAYYLLEYRRRTAPREPT